MHINNVNQIIYLNAVYPKKNRKQLILLNMIIITPIYFPSFYLHHVWILVNNTACFGCQIVIVKDILPVFKR